MKCKIDNDNPPSLLQNGQSGDNGSPPLPKIAIPTKIKKEGGEWGWGEVAQVHIRCCLFSKGLAGVEVPPPMSVMTEPPHMNESWPI